MSLEGATGGVLIAEAVATESWDSLVHLCVVSEGTEGGGDSMELCGHGGFHCAA